MIAIVHFVEIVGLAIELLVILLLVALFRPFRRRRRKKDDEFQLYVEPVRVHWAVKLLIILMPLLMLAAVIYTVISFRSTEQDQQAVPLLPPPVLPVGAGSGEQVGGGLGLGWGELFLAVLLAILAFMAILRALRMPPPTPRREPEPLPARTLATAASAGLRDARRETDPRRAVIVAYATMERILADAGYPRRAVEAPLEYLTRLFAELDVSGEALRTLTDLFELARFSQHPISLASREEAIAALTTIETALRAA